MPKKSVAEVFRLLIGDAKGVASMSEHEIPGPDSTAGAAGAPDTAVGQLGGGVSVGGTEHGLLLDRFEVKGSAWSSALGESWRAHDHELNRDVLLTRLPPELTGSEAIRKQLAAEVDTLTHLKDEAIVRIFDFIVRGRAEAILVEEFVDGEDLGTFMARDDILAPEEADAIALGILRAVETAHAMGILHRDLRPEHVFISRDGRIMVRGFSVARILRDQQTALARKMANKAQILAYSPPEDLLKQGMDHRGDLYSLGCLLYHVYAGRPPFAEGNIAYAQVHHAPPCPRDFNPAIPELTEEVILACLNKDPEDRYQSAADIRATLETPMIAKAESATRKRPRRLVPLALIAILVIAAAGAVLFVTRSKPGKKGVPPKVAAAKKPPAKAGKKPPIPAPKAGGPTATGPGGKPGTGKSGPGATGPGAKGPDGDPKPGPGGSTTGKAPGGTDAGKRPSGDSGKASPAGSSAAADPKSGSSKTPDAGGPGGAKTPATPSNGATDSGADGAKNPDAEPKKKEPTTEDRFFAQLKHAATLCKAQNFEQAIAAYNAASEILADRPEVNQGIAGVYCAWGDALADHRRLLDALRTYQLGLRFGEEPRNRLLDVRDRIVDHMKKTLSVKVTPGDPLLKVGQGRIDITLTDHPLRQVKIGDERLEPTGEGTYGHAFSGLADGAHSFKIEATDPAGNVVRREVIVRVDTHPPQVTSFKPEAGTALSTSKVVIQGKASEAITKVWCDQERHEVSITDDTFTLTVPVSGLRPEVRFAVTDRAGHMSRKARVGYYNPTWVPPGLEPRGEKFFSVRDQGYMVRVPGSQFILRDARGRPRMVKTDPYFVDVTEVTNAQYRRFLEWATKAEDPRQYSHPSEPPSKDHTPAFWGDATVVADDKPVVGVDWWDAYAFARWAGKSLPTDEAWELAARGVPESLYPWGDAPPRRTYANYAGGSTGGPVSVMSHASGTSPFGCHEMAGNVMEWCFDDYPETGKKLLRGGSFFHSARFLRTSSRVGFPPRLRTQFIGFRCAKFLR